MTFSVIISVSRGVENRERWDVFNRSLESLINLDYPHDSFEIVLVDSGSELSQGDWRAFEQRARKESVNLTILAPGQGNIGPARARNLGVEQVSKGETKIKSEYVAFTDDDCLVPKGWLNVFRILLAENQRAAGVGGVSLPTAEVCRRNAYARHDELIYGRYFPGGADDLQRLRQGKLPGYLSRKVLEHPVFSGNIAYRRDVFEKVGGFNRSYEAGVYGEDADLKERVLAAGDFLVFAPTLNDHRAPYNWEKFRLQQEGRGRGIMKFRADHYLSGQTPLEIYLRMLMAPLIFPVYLLSAGFDFRLAFLETQGYFFRQRGKIKYLEEKSQIPASPAGRSNFKSQKSNGRRIRILFADHTPLVGGAQLALLRHLSFLNRQQFEPFVLVDRRGSMTGRFKKLAGVKVAEVPFSQLKTLNPLVLVGLFASVLTISLKVVAWNPDLLVANTERAFYVLFLVSLVTRKKLILVLRDFEFSKFLLRLTSFRVAHFFCVSQKIRDFYGLTVLGSSVIYVGSDFKERLPEVSSAAVSDLKLSAGVRDQSLVIGFVGRLVEWKGPRILLEAFAQVLRRAGEYPLSLILVGEGPLRPELEDLAIKLGVASRVFFTGQVSDVAVWYKVFDIFVHASVAPEPFATTIVEAALAGLPIVATDTGGTREFIVDGQTGLLASPDSESLVDALVKLVEDKNLRVHLAKKAYEKADTELTEPKVTRRMEEIYYAQAQKSRQPSTLNEV